MNSKKENPRVFIWVLNFSDTTYGGDTLLVPEVVASYYGYYDMTKDYVLDSISLQLLREAYLE